MAEEAEIIYLEADDDIAAIRYRLEEAGAKQVYLVVPVGCRTLAKLVNLKLLQRYAADLSMEVALVSRDGATRVLAREVGLSVLSSVEGERRAERRPRPLSVERPKKARRREIRPVSQVSLPLELNIGREGQAILALGLLAGLFICSFLGIFLLIPQATVTITPVTEPISYVLEVRADPNATGINYEGMEVPARIVEAELEGEAQTFTTAKKDVPDAKASGTVSFINKGNEAVTIPQGTVVSTTGGTNIRFVTTSEVTLPATAGATAEVGIVALDPGHSGNVEAWTINAVEGALDVRVVVRNSAPTNGGTVKRVSIVIAEDKKRLRESLLQRLQQEAYSRLAEQLGELEFMPPESIQVVPLDEVFDKGVDEEADVLSLKIRVKASGTVIRGQDVYDLAVRFLESGVKEGVQLIPQSLRFQVGEVTRVEGRVVYFMAGISGSVTAKIDEGMIKRGIVGKSVVAAKRYLSQHLEMEGEPSIEVKPSWWGRVPWFPFRIRILFAGVEA